ncbi:hypothetical protein [Propionivibrio sp.]|uniref:hypothetical protein n=1 Tax=Propionivibrio sp. TaxID=2212460 RepID=UPI0025CE6C68|nr:hypothetical protein [Propionivibrio sp.]MBK7356349.1 hypothetical protein [Propionivibrio sp.]MBK8745687.1 hypothetical protein [Propionivibrio sp.]
MSGIKEVIRTAGDVRRTLAQTMVDVRTGDISVDKGMCVAALAKEITSSIQAEVNVAKVQASMLNEGKDMGKLTQLGRLIIEDNGTVPTLSGAAG